MPDFSALAFLPDLFGIGDPAFSVMRPDGTIDRIQAADVAALSGDVVSFETNILIDQLQVLGFAPPNDMIDIGDAFKLAAGRSKGDGGAKKWDFWRIWHQHGAADAQYRFTKELFFSKVEKPSDEDVSRYLETACYLLQELWSKARHWLKETDEEARFFAVEASVRKVFSARQSVGVKIDGQVVRTFLEVAKADKYRSYVEVAQALNVSPTGLSFRNIGQYLGKTDASHLEPFCSSSNVEEHFKIAAPSSSFAKNFVEYVRSSRDVSTLNRLMMPDQRIHPFFHVMGTVTGRVLVSEPFLQQLRRKFRDIVVADDGQVLIYLDYHQFEPGIIAHMSGDEQFIEAYNTSDLYTALSRSVFRDEEHRKLCKRVFLAFCYGMTKNGLVSLLAGAQADDAAKGIIADRLEQFFCAYPGLEVLKGELEQSLLQDGFVATDWGNRRYRTSEGHLTSEERRWSISQRIQGTASLIFKEAVLEIAHQISPSHILLPMHDAILLQFSVHDVAELKQQAITIMQDAFRKRCPSIQPKVSDEAFAGA